MRKSCFAVVTLLLLGSALVPASPASAQTPPAPPATPAPPPAGAPSPEALDAAKELFALLSKQMVGQLASQATAQIWPLIERELASKVDAPTLAELRQEFERIQRENLADVLQDAPAVYARHFTVAELRDLIAFNTSPTGRKMLQETPQIMGEVMAMLIPRMRDVQVHTQEAFEKILRERGYVQ